MDKKYQDIHYINNKSRKNVFVLREIEIRNISFKESYIEIDFIEIKASKKRKLYIVIGE